MTERERAELYQREPIRFFQDAWPGIFLWDKLVEATNLVCTNKRVVIPSGHGVGKTWWAARIVLWFLFCFPKSKVITTAPTWPQVELLLWSEIKAAYNSAAFNLGGTVLQTQIKIEEDWFAVGFSTRGKAAEKEFGTPKFQGYHSPDLMVLLDEAPGVEHEIWVSAETLITGKNNRLVAIGNPTSPSGDFYNACLSPLWAKLEISSFDHPNVVTGQILVPGAVTRAWIEERRRDWGEDSPLWQAKVLGQFPTESVDTLVPLAWAEACVGLDLGIAGDKKLGADIARFGGDMTVLARLYGPTLQPLEAVNKKDTSWTIGRIQVLNRDEQFDYIAVDDTGVGGGVTDGLNDMEIDVEPMNFGGEAIEKDKFENLKAEIYWNLREAIKNKAISLPDDKELINQLCSIKYAYTRRGKIKIESKDDQRRRGLKSPDKADAVAIAFSAGREAAQATMSVITLEDGE